MSRRYLRTNKTRFPRYVLTAAQHQLVDDVCNSLPPGEMRNSFRLRVAARLGLSAGYGSVADELVVRCINSALSELGVAA